MDLAGLSLLKVSDQTIIKPFDCGDEDLNSFLFTKSIPYAKELLATTYILEDENETVAFFSIFNDIIRVEDLEFASKSVIKRFLSDLLPHSKRHLKNFPALKIGRLGVSKNHQKKGLGCLILKFIIDIGISKNDHCACKFISVDAYDQSLAFYEKSGFAYFSANDAGKDTRQMYLDLTPIINAVVD